MSNVHGRVTIPTVEHLLYKSGCIFVRWVDPVLAQAVKPMGKRRFFYCNEIYSARAAVIRFFFARYPLQSEKVSAYRPDRWTLKRRAVVW